jgi:hypothetical protein
MSVYKGFNLNDSSTPPPWGPREQQVLKDLADTVVSDTIQGASDTAGHKHDNLYFTGGAASVQCGSSTVGIGMPPGPYKLEVQGDVNLPYGSHYKVDGSNVIGLTGIQGLTGIAGPVGTVHLTNTQVGFGDASSNIIGTVALTFLNPVDNADVGTLGLVSNEKSVVSLTDYMGGEMIMHTGSTSEIKMTPGSSTDAKLYISANGGGSYSNTSIVLKTNAISSTGSLEALRVNTTGTRVTGGLSVSSLTSADVLFCSSDGTVAQANGFNYYLGAVTVPQLNITGIRNITSDASTYGLTGTDYTYNRALGFSTAYFSTTTATNLLMSTGGPDDHMTIIHTITSTGNLSIILGTGATQVLTPGNGATITTKNGTNWYCIGAGSAT